MLIGAALVDISNNSLGALYSVKGHQDGV